MNGGMDPHSSPYITRSTAIVSILFSIPSSPVSHRPEVAPRALDCTGARDLGFRVLGI